MFLAPIKFPNAPFDAISLHGFPEASLSDHDGGLRRVVPGKRIHKLPYEQQRIGFASNGRPCPVEERFEDAPAGDAFGFAESITSSRLICCGARHSR